jgi:hypothetical protein
MADTSQRVIEQASAAERLGDPPGAWITIAQLQGRFGIGRTTAYAWAHRLPADVCMRIGEKKLLVNERKLISYLEQKGTRQALSRRGERYGK